MFPKQFTPPPLRVSILVLPETAPMAVYGLYEVLGSVGKIWPQLTGEVEKVREIAPRIVAKAAEPFTSVIGVPITPQAAIDDDDDADVVIVCDIELPLRGDPEDRWTEEIAWVRAALDRGALVCSTCSGSVLLAEAGPARRMRRSFPLECGRTVSRPLHKPSASGPTAFSATAAMRAGC
jgi:transcriptional regulator GlxA family with amidase domain